MVELLVLGPLDVRAPARGSLATVLAQPRRSALLAVLAVEGGADGFVSRDRLLGLFWPESDEPRARAALRQALAFLRRTLGADALRARGDDAIGLDPAVVGCDAWAAEVALATGRPDDALSLVRGPFADGLLVDDAPAVEQWVAEQRRHWERTLGRAAVSATERRVAAGDVEGALATARLAADWQPLDEAAHRLLLQLLDRTGNRATALREHAQFVERLAGELEIGPSAPTLALVAQLRAGAGEGAEAEAVTVSPAEAPPQRSAERPRPAGGRRWPVVAAAGLALLALGWWTAGRQSDPQSFGGELSGRRIAVLPLLAPADSSGAVGTMAADWIVDGLSRLDGVQVVPLSSVIAALGRTPDTPGATSPADAADWARLAAELGAGVVVRGTVYREGGGLHLQAQLLDTRTHQLVRAVDPVRVPADSLVLGIDRLRTRVLAAAAPLADSVTHLRHAIAPPSLEAYQDYVAGLQAFMQRGDVREALRLFDRAAAVDSVWPIPRLSAAIMHANLDEADEAAALLHGLRPVRERLAPLEAATFDMTDALLRGDLAAAYDASVRQARLAPGTIGHYMVAELARRMGRPLEALSVLDELDPERGELRGWHPYWRERTYALHLLGRYADEAEAARRAIRTAPQRSLSHSYLLRALAALGDTAALATARAAFDATTSAVALRAESRAVTMLHLARHHPAMARVELPRTLAWFAALPAVDREAAPVRLSEARVLVLADRPADAADRLAPLLAMPWPRMPTATLGRLGVLTAATGQRGTAQRIATQLADRARALSTPARGLAMGEHAFWQAAIAAQLGDRELALERLRDARRQGLASDPRLVSEPAFDRLRAWGPMAALLADGG